jgi:hypothetical protein
LSQKYEHIPCIRIDRQRHHQMVNEVSILCNQRTSLEVDWCPLQLRPFHLYYGKINSSESNYETLLSHFTSLYNETGMITSKHKNTVILNYSLNVAREKDEIETSGRTK